MLSKKSETECIKFFFYELALKGIKPDVHLCESDVAVDSASNPILVRLRFKALKNDLF